PRLLQQLRVVQGQNFLDLPEHEQLTGHPQAQHVEPVLSQRGEELRLDLLRVRLPLAGLRRVPRIFVRVRGKHVAREGRTEAWTREASEPRSGTGNRPHADCFRPGILPPPLSSLPILAGDPGRGYA